MRGVATSKEKTIAVLGAGPAGLGLAWRLVRRPLLQAKVVVVEQASDVGGLAASFAHQGLHFDYGSHRLHRATSPEILSDIRVLLGEDLLDRPRNGRILVQGRFVKFPLQPVDLMLHLPPSFVVGFIGDVLRAPLRRRQRRPERTFADVLHRGLGPTMCQSFYFPYAHKLWGMAPEHIDAVQAQRRVAAMDTGKLLKKALALLPGVRRAGTGRFFYPKRGYGQICQVLAAAIREHGGEIVLNARVISIAFDPEGRRKVEVRWETPEGEHRGGAAVEADFVFTTIPLPMLVSALRPEAPANVMRCAEELHYRGMILLYLVLRTERFSPYDAHYLPGQEIVASRLSEPKNYSGTSEPQGRTGLCAEIPCTPGDALWQTSDRELSGRLLLELERAGLPVTAPIVAVFSRRLTHAYPVYEVGFGRKLAAVESYLATVPKIVSLGRQGLFAHDNTHHTLQMAYRASECLADDLNWHQEAWRRHREAFAKHVVED